MRLTRARRNYGDPQQYCLKDVDSKWKVQGYNAPQKGFFPIFSKLDILIFIVLSTASVQNDFHEPRCILCQIYEYTVSTIVRKCLSDTPYLYS